MLRAFLIACGLCAAGAAAAQGVYHQGYTRRDGGYVQPHWQSQPNGSRLDNYGTQGNMNPYSGRMGTESPYPSFNAPRAPSYGSGNSGFGSPYSNPYRR